MQTGTLGKTVSFVTLGCAKNEVDSNHMQARLEAAGYALEDDPERADVVIVNTCSFIQSATEESIEAILDVAGFESVAQGKAHLVVAGCMPARYGSDLESELSEADDFVPCSREDDIVSVVDGLFGVERMPGDGLALPVVADAFDSVFAYVKISDGCDRFCSYCSIPYIRGRYHSFEYERVEAEVDELVARGVREIVLIAQDTGRWGNDFDEPKTFAWLVSQLAERHPGTWFRVLYIQPEGITDELVEAVASHDNICSYFDVPFQHANQDVLKSMNRKGSGAEFTALLDSILERIPDAVLRTTLIAGFPGETDEQFEELVEFVEEAPLDYVGVFAYSREEGTRAYDLDGQVDDDEKLYRAQRLRDAADSASSARIAQRVGSQVDVLVCGTEEDGQLYGRTMGQAPEVDGVTYIDAGQVGSIVRVEIEDSLLYEMEGTAVS